MGTSRSLRPHSKLIFPGPAEKQQVYAGVWGLCLQGVRKQEVPVSSPESAELLFTYQDIRLEHGLLSESLGLMWRGCHSISIKQQVPGAVFRHLNPNSDSKRESISAWDAQQLITALIHWVPWKCVTLFNSHIHLGNRYYLFPFNTGGNRSHTYQKPKTQILVCLMAEPIFIPCHAA